MIIGRDGPLAVLAGAVDALCRRRGGFVLVAGEAGIGKTSMLTAAADDASARGALALAGACWDGDGVPGYWPWIQVMRGLQRAVGDERWRLIRQAAGDGLAGLLGESPSRKTGAGQPGPDGAAGFQLLDAVSTALIAAAERKPLLIVLDDLQWADAASVRMLDFVVRHAALDAVLVAAAYRDTDIEAAGHPLRPALARAASTATVIQLGGLDEASVADLVARTAGSQAAPDIAEEIRRRTGGNPFFVQQVASLWAATGSTGGVAFGLRDAIERRLAWLPPGCLRLLTTAALLGAKFDLGVAAAASAMTDAEATNEIAAAAAVRVVVPGEGGSLRFAHDLVREYLRDSLAELEARGLHAAIVSAAAGQAASAMLPAQLAQHAYLAVPQIGAEQAAGYLLAAGRDASRRLAADEACAHFGRAHDLLDGRGLPGAREAAIQLGIHQQQAGDVGAARDTFARAISAARATDDAGAFARGVLGLRSLGTAHREGPGTMIELVDEARSRLAAGRESGQASPLLAMITAAAGQARSHTMGSDRGPSQRLSAEAVAMAREHGEAEALGFCLLARHDAIWRPGTAGERLALADEALALARRTADRELELRARHLRMVALLEAGHPAGLAEQEAFSALAEQTRRPRSRYLALSRQATISTLQGRFADARRQAAASLELGRQIGEVDAEGVWHDQICELARLQGRQDELDRLIADDQAAGNPLGAVVAALAAVDFGPADAALARFSEISRLTEQWPQWAGLMVLASRAQLAAVAGDQRLRDAVRAEIAPLRDQWVVLAGAVVVHGPMAYWLAELDAADGRWDAARGGYDAAERMADLFGARPWSILARLGKGAAILGRAEDRRRTRSAAVLLSAAEAEAAELGMAPAAARARRLMDGIDGPVGTAAAEAGVFRFDGEVWTLTFGGLTSLLADAKGLHDLHELLAHPGAEIAAAALLAPAGGRLAAAAAGFGADPVLDETARAMFAARLAVLDEEIDGALARRDDERARRLDGERAALVTELRAASGLGGRSRLLGAEAERARKTVTARIRDALRRLDARHPPLAGHLRATIVTGTHCSYRPPAPGGVDWQL